MNPSIPLAIVTILVVTLAAWYVNKYDAEPRRHMGDDEDLTIEDFINQR